MKNLTQNEAIRVALGVVTAMAEDDKEGREAVYADLSAADLRRVIRWLSRWYIVQFHTLCFIHGIDPLSAWKENVMALNQAMADGTIEEME